MIKKHVVAIFQIK